MEADNNILQIISYIISVVIGGVGYKFLNLLLTHKTETRNAEMSSDQKLIDNLQKSLVAITNRVTELEQQREESHKREIEVTKQLSSSQSKVKYLEDKIQKLEEDQKKLKQTLSKYYKKYGYLEE